MAKGASQSAEAQTEAEKYGKETGEKAKTNENDNDDDDERRRSCRGVAGSWYLWARHVAGAVAGVRIARFFDDNAVRKR